MSTGKENLFTSFQTLDKEAFIIILGKIWEKWASAESINRKGIKAFGISEFSLADVENM